MQAVEILDETDLAVTLRITGTPPGEGGRVVCAFLDTIDPTELEGLALTVEPRNAVRGTLAVLRELAKEWQ